MERVLKITDRQPSRERSILLRNPSRGPLKRQSTLELDGSSFNELQSNSP
jgi:hypothetical protein